MIVKANFLSVRLLSICLILLSVTVTAPAEEENTLWYDQPASEWIEALPLGNGRLGGMVVGSVPNETIHLNEESLWAGEPADRGSDRKYCNREHRVANLAMHIGRPLLGQRVDDLLTAADVLSTRKDVKEIDLVGIGRAGPVVLHAAALDERFSSVTVRKSINSWIHNVVEKPLGHDLLGCVVPGALLKYDLPDLVRAIAPRKVNIATRVAREKKVEEKMPIDQMAPAQIEKIKAPFKMPQLTRRRFLQTTAASVIGISGCSLAKSENSADKKPNIVLILADDLGMHQVGCYGTDFYETPYIDKLAAEGMRFTNAYAACHVCSPTRASIMTGKYPARLGVTDFIPGMKKPPAGARLVQPDWNMYLDIKEVTIAESLKAAGYATGHFGKWHLNIDKKYKPGRVCDPGSQGFDDVLTTHKPKAGPPSKYENDAHHVREITERSVAFIARNKNKPFFCYVTHNSIHSPELEREKLIAKYNGRPGAKKSGRLNPVQAAMLETLDKSVGTICEKIRELGIERNTIVVFFSDNGQLGPDEGQPFRGSKGNFYEGRIRMPFVVKWPGVVTAGSVCDEVMISTDFFPTFNEIAGVRSSVKNVDGVSLVPVLKDANARLGRQAVYWHFPHYRKRTIGPHGAMRKGRYKLIEWYEKSAFGEDGAFEVYDLLDDPAEQKNLADSKPALVKSMVAEFEKWRKDIGAQEMTIDQTAPAHVKKIKAPFKMPQLTRPVFKDQTFSIIQYDAKSDGKENSRGQTHFSISLLKLRVN